MKFVSYLRLLLAGSWLGAAAMFIVVAQVSFAVLPERELAGMMVNRTLAIVNYSGLAISLVLLATTFLGTGTSSFAAVWGERILLAIFAAATALSQFVIAWWILLVRQQMGRPIDQVPAESPLRTQFNTLHTYSEYALITAFVAAAIVFFIIANRRFEKPKKSGDVDFDFQKEFKV